MPKSLKEQNRWQICLIVAANVLFLYTITKSGVIQPAAFLAGLKDTTNLFPVGMALVVSVVLNGLLSADNKAKLVFLHWNYALPGHRVFTKYAKNDPRIDLSVLAGIHGSPLPQDPVEQNRLWYRFYKAVDSDPAVLQVHRDFLLLRDYTGLSALFVVFFGATALYVMPSLKIACIYLLILFLQYVVVRQAAATYGIRMATTALAQRATKTG